MKKLVCAVMALTLLGPGAAFAQRGDQGRQDQRAPAGPVRDNPHWSRGDKLPQSYRDQQYEVTDWQARHLRRPPRGYHWVRADNRYVLAAIATGLIADVILNAQ